MKTFILRLLGRNPKKKEGGHYKLRIKVSRPLDDDTTMSWCTVEAEVMPASEGHFMSREFAENLGFDITALLEHTPLDELEFCIHWKNLSRDQTRTKDYTHMGKFGIGAGLRYDIVLGRDTWDLEEYPDSYEGAVKIESSKSRTNSWVSKLSSKSPSWASSRNTLRRATSSKRGSIYRHGTGDLEQNKPRSHAFARDETCMPAMKNIILDATDTAVATVANCHSDTTASLENNGIERVRPKGTGEALRQRGEHRAVFETSDGPIEKDFEPVTKGAESLHLDLLRSPEATGALSSATVYRDFSLTGGRPISPASPAEMADTGTMTRAEMDALHVEIRIGSGQNDLPSIIPSDHRDNLTRPCTPPQRASNVARSVGSDYTRSPQPRYDWNQSQSGSNSVKSESTGFADTNLAFASQPRNKNGDMVKKRIVHECSRLSPEYVSGQNFNSPVTTAHPYQVAVEKRLLTPITLGAHLDVNDLHPQDLAADSGKASEETSPKLGSGHENRPKKSRRAADLISPRRVAPSPSENGEDRSAEIQKKGTHWTWDEHANAHFHVDSDTQSMIWYEDSDSEDL
ncbi:hypothetical protein BKA65DRAFT_477149 [Rhexocercosporidium sp. MPI-PUGE-AT-0058]|nr:hypothetical protein BKA65DRAFT_477149 [Rhexocercosporidium sp. MPI-PUGE-AT-0058]